MSNTSCAGAANSVNDIVGESLISDGRICPIAIRKSCSTPVLSTLGIAEGRLDSQSCNAHTGLDVYVVARPIRRGGKVFRQLSDDVKQSFVPLGVCHYMTVFETSDGRLVQFDFGPTGGDVHKGAPISWMLRRDKEEEKAREASEGSGVGGEIREQELFALPDTHLFVGRTALRLSDIRSYNAVQSLHYELHKNDCRHYVNSLVEFTTGVTGASRHLVREAFHKKKQLAPPWNAKAVELAQCFTDVQNWGKVRAASSTTMATLLAWTGRGFVGRVAAKKLTPALRAVSAPSFGASFVRYPLGGAAAAAATSVSAWSDIPVLRETLNLGAVVNKGIESTATSAVGFVVWMRAQNPVQAFFDLAMTPSPSPSGVPASLGSNVVRGTAALALAITRGAAGLVARERQPLTKSKKRGTRRQGLRLDRGPRLGLQLAPASH